MGQGFGPGYALDDAKLIEGLYTIAYLEEGWMVVGDGEGGELALQDRTCQHNYFLFICTV